ncbi:MAG: DoxX family membrane protein [Jatrophihabitantaceae bacterium]
MRSTDEPVGRTDPAVPDRRRILANSWPVLPLRLFLAALFCFAGYAKFSYPGFFDDDSSNGFKSAVDAARDGDTPLGGAMGPLSDHASLFGHLTAYAEIAIGLGLLVGLLTRIAALGGMILTAMIVLSINWSGVKEYTGSSGWFTSVELALIAALSVFLLGGAGPFALDNLFIRARERQRARDDAEPSFRDSELDDSRRRLQGDPGAMPGAGAPTAQMPVVGGSRGGDRDVDPGPGGYRSGEREVDPGPDGGATAVYRPEDRGGSGLRPADSDEAGHRTGRQDEEYRDDPEPEPNSLWTKGRRAPDQQPEPRRDGEPPGQPDR